MEKDKLIELLDACIDHLEYCNYGDSWESECAEALKKRVSDYHEGEPDGN